MHAFLYLLVEGYLASFLKLIISFLVHCIYYYHSPSEAVIYCCLVAARSSNCILSLGWPTGLVQSSTSAAAIRKWGMECSVYYLKRESRGEKMLDSLSSNSGNNVIQFSSKVANE
jgi:hypothetical protein